MSILLNGKKCCKILAAVIKFSITTTNINSPIVAALPSCCWMRHYSLIILPPPTQEAASTEKAISSQLLNSSVKLNSFLTSTRSLAPLPVTFSSCSCSRRHEKQLCVSQRHSYCTYHKYRKDMDVPAGLFHGSVDRFNGITVDSQKEHEPNVGFAEKLKKSMEYWQANKRRVIWFKVYTEHIDWVPTLAKCGFDFHHANKGFVYMNRWIAQNESPNIPDYAHTFLGVGGLVVNEKDEVLVVTDRFAMIPNSWKLPGGYVDPRENIIEAAIREVKEETGISCEFNTMISLRHAHGGSFGGSDMYAVVALTPTNLDITRCQREISRVQWMPIVEYMQHPHVHETNRFFMSTFLDYRKRGLRFTCKSATHEILKKDYMLYYIQPIEEEQQKICDKH